MSATASQLFFTKLLSSRREVCGTVFRGMYCRHMSLSQKTRASVSLQGSAKQVQACTHYITGTTSKNQDKASLNFLRDKKILPDSDPPSGDDVNLLYQFIDHSHKLMVLTGAGISTESGIPDYRSPNGAYSSGFKPITHQEFVRSSRARKRYWARSYAGWRRFTAAKPGPTHTALAALEKVGRINFMVTQNVDRLHHRAGSNPLEIHGTVYSVICLQCGFSFSRNVFQDLVKTLNPKWASAVESLDCGNPGSDKSFGMQQRPDGDIEIDEKYWEEDFHIPNCQKCDGVLKPDVVFFGDNVPKDRANKAMEAANRFASGVDQLAVFRAKIPFQSAEMRLSSSGFGQQPQEDFTGEKRCLNSELWHACAGPLVSLPAVGSRVVYFPQGHSEQVAASTNKEVDAHIPNYPNLPPQLVCQLHNVTMHADVETDEVYAQMTLQPLSPQEQKDAYLPAELGAPSKQPTNYFCKTLTASDTSTHGGFSVPRRAAEKVFPPLDFSQQPPAQELIARDLHDNEWKFRHIFRGQPKRHLLTTGWSVFVSAKRLVAGDSVLFIWNEKNQLLLGIRRANRPQTVMPSSVLSSDSMHIGLLAAAAHAAATNSRFTIFYNPRASPSEFVIPFSKYVKAVYHTRVSVGMRFRMLFETEESSVRRYMGTITGIGDLDPVRWPNSHWRSVKVGWDESTAGERQPRVSLWEIEPLTTFPMYPSPFPLRLKRPWPPGLPSLHGGKDDDLGLSSLMWLRGDSADRSIQSLNFQGIGVTPWMQPRLDASMLGLQPDVYQAMAAAALQEIRNVDPSKQAPPSLLQFQQSQNIPNISASLLQRQILQQSQPQSPHAFIQSIQDNLSQSQSQAHLIQQQLQHQQSFNSQQQKQQQQQQQQQQQHQQRMADQQQLPNVASSLSQLASTKSQAPLQSISSLCQQPNFPDSNGHPAATSGVSPLQSLLGTFSSTDASNLLSLPRSSPLIPHSAAWLPKQVAEPMLPSVAQCVIPQVDQLGPPQSTVSQNSVTLPPFPGRECSVDQEGSTDPQSHLLFGVNIDSSSLLLQNSMSNLRSVGSETDSTTMPFAASNFLTNMGTDFPLNPTMNTSNCLDESVFLQSPDNVGQVADNVGQGNPPTRTFVKVHKSGSFGRSLDITRFSSYHELRSELAHMFGLEGQLEDPMRSGWQLVFVDRENDVLLLGDDPWQEFVNSVWCIKILSPQEVQEMGQQGRELLNSVPIQRLPSTSCDDYVSRQDSRNLSSGITSVGSLEY